jgi:hypothetical protein
MQPMGKGAKFFKAKHGHTGKKKLLKNRTEPKMENTKNVEMSVHTKTHYRVHTPLVSVI